MNKKNVHNMMINVITKILNKNYALKMTAMMMITSISIIMMLHYIIVLINV